MKIIITWLYRFLLLLGILLSINMGLWELVIDKNLLLGIAGIFAIPFQTINLLWI
jgi:hypothetical protein